MIAMEQTTPPVSPRRDTAREGAVLAVVLIMVLLLGILSTTLLKDGEYVGVETSRGINDARAFWAAEAGLGHARAVLLKGLNGGGAWSAADTGLSYAVTMVPSNATVYVAVSTGTVHDAVRIVSQVIEITTWPEAFNYGLFSDDGLLWIKKDAVVSNGNIYSADEYKIDGTIYIPNGTTNSPIDFPPDEEPTMPIVTNVYDQMIAQAAFAGQTNAPAFPLALNQATNYYSLAGGLSITGMVSGGGVLVVSGGVDINAAVGSNLQIISGGQVNVNLSGALGSNVMIYAVTGIRLGTTTGADPMILTNGSDALVTPGWITAEKDLTFHGLMYAGQEVWFKKEATVVGAVLAGEGMKIEKSLTLTYDAGQFSDYVSFIFLPQVAVNSRLWREIAP